MFVLEAYVQVTSSSILSFSLIARVQLVILIGLSGHISRTRDQFIDLWLVMLFTPVHHQLVIKVIVAHFRTSTCIILLHCDWPVVNSENQTYPLKSLFDSICISKFDLAD